MKTTLLFVLALSGLSVLSAQPKREYHYVRQLKTWTEAQSYCRQKYTDLATIRNSTDHNRLVGKVKGSNRKSVWIGLYDGLTRWKWVLGGVDFNSDTDFSNWRSTEPVVQPHKRSCAVMSRNGLWHSSSCGAKHPAVCYNGGRRSRYVVLKKKRTYNEALKLCRSKHTSLVSVRSLSQNKRIASLLSEKTWIGLQRRHWTHWSDRGTSNFIKWGKGEPSNSGIKRASCAAISTLHGTLGDFHCESKLHFVCQKVEDWHKTTLKLKFQSEADLNDPAVQQQILEQLHAKLEKHILPDFKLRWIETDGQTFHKEKKREKDEGSGD